MKSVKLREQKTNIKAVDFLYRRIFPTPLFPYDPYGR
jgi:hypothetical protein